MTFDPKALAAEMSADLAPTKIPDDLSSVADADLFELCVHAAAHVLDVTENLKNTRPYGDTEHEHKRLKAIRRIKKTKLCRLFDEDATRRDTLVPTELVDMSFADLQELRRRIEIHRRWLKTIQSQRAEAPRADHRLIAGITTLLDMGKSALPRLHSEFQRRKTTFLDVDRFLVRVAPSEPEALEAYINATRAQHPGWWPHIVMARGDNLMMIWKTKDPPSLDEDDSPILSGDSIIPWACDSCRTSNPVERGNCVGCGALRPREG